MSIEGKFNQYARIRKKLYMWPIKITYWTITELCGLIGEILLAGTIIILYLVFQNVDVIENGVTLVGQLIKYAYCFIFVGGT